VKPVNLASGIESECVVSAYRYFAAQQPSSGAVLYFVTAAQAQWSRL